MAIGMTREVGVNSIPIWQGTGKDIQLAQGGFSLAATGLTAGAVIPAGTGFVFDEATRVATLWGGAVLYADATDVATTYQVKKGHTFVVGKYLASVVGGKAYAITAIDTTTSTLYDILTVGTTLGVALTAGANFFSSTATGASAAALPAINGLLYDDTLANTGESVSLVIRGTVYARRIPFTYSTALAALTGMKNIIFSQSK